MQSMQLRFAGRSFLMKAVGIAVALAATGQSTISSAHAQDVWPSRPIKFIVPLAPGGAIDFVARAVGEYLTKSLGQPIIVENRTGAGGTVGMDGAMRSPPDGYTVLITNDNAASAPHVMKLPHDYTQELEPVIFLSRQPQVLCAHPSLGVKTVAELIAKAKSSPDLTYATSGFGTNQHVIGEWFAREAGIALKPVHYRGAGAAINDLVGGHVKLAWLGPTATVPHYKAGTLGIVAQSSGTRAPYIAEIPTVEQAGFKGMVLEAWYGAFVPKGTPAEIIARLNAEMAKAVADPAMKVSFEKGSMEGVGGTAAEFGKIAREDSVKYERLVRELNIKGN